MDERMQRFEDALSQLSSALNLSASEKQRVRKMTIELVRNSHRLTEQDISRWRAAWQYALNIEKPDRRRLHSLYIDTEIDGHLSGAIQQRCGMTTQKSFRLTDKDKNENKELTELFETAWFKDFVDYALQSIFWGHSLIELGNVITGADGKIKYDQVTLVPRNHVVPEYSLILKNESDQLKHGFDYRERPLSDWVIEVGKKDNLGLLLKATPHAISKRHSGSFWDQFEEIFGIPLRIAKTTSRDEKDRARIEQMMQNLGAAAWALFPEGTDVEIKEASHRDAYQVFDKRIERCNSELSKIILVQTMTIDDGSSRSQSETHLEVFKNLVAGDADLVRDAVNDKLIPRMIAHGFPLEGYTFDWDEGVDIKPEIMQKVEEMVMREYDIDPEYYVEKYNIPVLGKKEKKEDPPQLKQTRFFD
jgi:phage gp29-like protein